MKRWGWLLLLTCLLFPMLAGTEAIFEYDGFLQPGEECQITGNEYLSQNIHIVITSMRREHSDVHVADIHIRSLDCCQRALAHDKWKSGTMNIREFAEQKQGILVMTGDSSTSLPGGLVIVNGEVMRSTMSKKYDLCILYRDGTMVTLPHDQLDPEQLKAEQENIWQAFVFGPRLLDDDGKAIEKFSAFVKPENPRSVIGYYEPGHYCFVQVDGRRTESVLEEGKANRGLTLNELSLLMEELGCKCAYNLDGGQSSMLYFHDDIFSTPYKNGRRLADVVLIREPENPDSSPAQSAP